VSQATFLNRQAFFLRPDPARVIVRPFKPATEPRDLNPTDKTRANHIVDRVLALDSEAVAAQLADVLENFEGRHRNLLETFEARAEVMEQAFAAHGAFSKDQRQLIGAYFLNEYSFEASALFNPSIVRHPDQSDAPKGGLRFILSLRATGEGHISSITFRTGVIHPGNPDPRIEVVAPTGFLSEPRQIPNAVYEKPLFGRKLCELGLGGDVTNRVMNRLGESFTLDELRTSLEAEVKQYPFSDGMAPKDQNAAQGIWLLARSNYEVQFQPEQELSERVIFPATPSQRNGIEDSRFVCFQNDDGSHVYYATFTAYDGRVVTPELVETTDFLRFRFITLNGPAAQNKGMALFPRKIDGHFAMLSRQDNENITLMFSDNVHFWNEYNVLLEPAFPWELVQLGNCGSPIETDAGWLVLSHGVGPLRRYCIGAFLLDRDDPSKVIGRLREPLLQPNENEREGYVPNVVYTCGAIVHNGQLIIPYGLADHATGFATVPLAEVLGAMQ